MNDLVDRLARQAGLTANVVWVLVALALALAAGSAVRLGRLLRPAVPPEERRARLGSLATWWALFALLVLIAVLGEGAAVAVFAGVSLLGLGEYRALTRARIAPVRLWWHLVYLAVLVHYLLMHLGWLDAFRTFIPIWAFGILLVRLAVAGQTGGFLETAGITFLGLMLVVFLLSHAALLLKLPDVVNPAGGAFGLFLFLVVLTEGNDIAQALWGRLLGRRKITPTLSPKKTWEGFLLGAATTVILSLVLAGFLTPFADRPVRVGPARYSVPYLPALASGVLIAAGGFLGDVSMSAVKRESGVKDSGTLLPAQGGVLDRFDSLTFTGPLFYYFIDILYGRGTL
jgi:phosphatidate cytidylyltransferase